MKEQHKLEVAKHKNEMTELNMRIKRKNCFKHEV